MMADSKYNWPAGKWQPVAGRVFVDEQIAIELLDALKECSDLLGRSAPVDYNTTQGWDAIDRARAAIAAAEGK